MVNFEAKLESADFETNTLTFKVDKDFWNTRSLYGGLEISFINCPNIKYCNKEPNDDLAEDAMPDCEATLNFEQETWERLKELEKHLNLQHKENLTVAECLVNIQSSINNINKRLGDLEADIHDNQPEMKSCDNCRYNVNVCVLCNLKDKWEQA